MPGTEHPVIVYANAAREKLLKGEKQRAVRLVNVYGAAYQRLQVYIDAFESRLQAQVDTEEPITQAQTRDLDAYKALLQQTENEIRRFSTIAGEEMSQGAREAIAQAQGDALKEIQLSIPAIQPGRIKAVWRGVPSEAVETLLGMTEPGSPLRDAMESTLGAAVAKQAADRILTNVALGKNPRTTAREISKDLGAGLTWTLKTVRTAQLWGYRASKHESWAQNPKLYRGWTWHAHLGARTCAACIALHGSQHSPDEILNDHHNGRCDPLPITPTYQEIFGLDEPIEGDVPPAARIEPGVQWFEGLSEGEQRSILGGARFNAYKAGKLTMDSDSKTGIVGTRQDAVYGPMKIARSLKSILGDDASDFYDKPGGGQGPKEPGPTTPEDDFDAFIMREERQGRELFPRPISTQEQELAAEIAELVPMVEEMITGGDPTAGA